MLSTTAKLRTGETMDAARGGMTHPVADVVGRTDVDEGADAALEKRGDVVVCREGEHVEVRVERLVDRVRAPVEGGSANVWIDADERLDVLIVEKVANIPERASQDCVSDEDGRRGEMVHTE